MSPPDQSLVDEALCYGKPELAMYLVERGSSVLAKDYNLHGPNAPITCTAIKEGRSTLTHSCLKIILMISSRTYHTWHFKKERQW